MEIRCNQCPRRCNAIRTSSENIGGFCKMPSEIVVARAALHHWEEPCISGSRGSGTIFFSGCSLGCVFCQNHEISSDCFGKPISQSRLIEIIKGLETAGAHNINFVTPTHYFDLICNALSEYRPVIPIVYNSSGYDLPENILKNIFDIYLFDLKYISNDTSAKYSNAVDYFEFASKSIKAAYDLVGPPVFDQDGILQRGVIIRHLLLPNHTREAMAVIDWAEKNCPKTIFSFMSQYVPFRTDSFKEINRKITKREYEKVAEYLSGRNFEHIYLQSLDSSDAKFVPVFDLFGI